MKKSAVLLMLLLGSLLSAKAYDALVGGVYYNLIGSQAYVTYPGDELNPRSDYSGDVYIPATIRHNGRTYKVFSVGEGAFEGCDGLTSVTLPGSLLSINTCAFADCKSLQWVSMPATLHTLCGGGFSACGQLRNFQVPASVSIIPDMAFYACRNLRTVELSENTDSIGERAFEYCRNLRDLYCLATAVPHTNPDAFAGLDLSQCTLHVAEGCAAAYRNAELWKEFGSIAEEDPTSIASEKVDSKSDGMYSIDGKRQQHAQRVTLFHYTDGTTRKVLR